MPQPAGRRRYQYCPQLSRRRLCFSRCENHTFLHGVIEGEGIPALALLHHNFQGNNCIKSFLACIFAMAREAGFV